MDRAKQIEARILDGARRYFMAHGFRSVTMGDLAAELGMSKKTLYAHFDSKAELMRAVVADKAARVEADLSAVAEDNELEFPEKLHGLLAAVRAHTEEIQPAFLRDIARELPDLFETIRERRRETIRRCFGKTLRQGRTAGMIRKDVPERVMIEFLIGAADAIVNPQMLSELGLTPRAAFSEIIALFLEGATTGKGRLKL